MQSVIYLFCPKVMIDFQAAERKRLEESASVDLEPLYAMLCFFLCRIYYIFNTQTEPHAFTT